MYPKSQQTNKNKIKDKKVPWGQRKPKKPLKSKGSFGKKPSPIKRRATRVKSTDVIDDHFADWLCTQPCAVTGKVSERGLGQYNMQGHHIDGRNPSRNDYIQVPLIGYAHVLATYAVHQCAHEKFIDHWKIDLGDCENIKEYFYSMVSYYIEKYESETGREIDRKNLRRK